MTAHAVVEHKLYWASVSGEAEAHYLSAILNSATGVSAATLAFPDRIGQLAPGFRSRFILTPHEPLKTVAHLHKDKTIFFDGAAVNYQLVLTKADKVKPTDLAKTLEAVASEARKHPAAHPGIFTTSSETGTGIAELRTAILEAAIS